MIIIGCDHGAFELKQAVCAYFDENGIEYLQDIEEYSNVENFPYYYAKLKKLNLLNDFKKQGFDISDFYIEDLLDPRSLEVNQKFEELTSQDIVNNLDAFVEKFEELIE